MKQFDMFSKIQVFVAFIVLIYFPVNFTSGKPVDTPSAPVTPSKKGGKFASLRCGIGGRWNPVVRMCTPVERGNSLDSAEDEDKHKTILPESKSAGAAGAAGATGAGVVTGSDDGDVPKKVENIKYQVISIRCGIGYRYIKKDQMCKRAET